MKILFLTPDFVLPANRGLRVRILAQLQIISAMPEVEHIELLSLSAAEVPIELLRALERQVPKLHAEVPAIRDISVRQSQEAMLRFLHRRLLCNEPYLLAVHNVQKMREIIGRCLWANRFDVVYVGYLGLMTYADCIKKYAPQAALILEQHNIEWQIFERLASSLPVPKRQIVQLEACALKSRETSAMQQVDSVVAISELDAKYFRDHAGADATVVPPFVELSPQDWCTTDEPRLGYIGHLAWQPNVLGLNWFCTEVWPKILQSTPNARLTIAGPGLRKNATGMLDVPPEWQCAGIRTVGFIDDLNELYNSTLGMIAPVIGGSGVRMKLLETLSVGMPTVTTTDGAAGLSVVHEREMLIADRAQDFAECVVRVLVDGALRKQLRERGFEYLKSNHSMSVASDKMRDAISRAMSRAKAR